MRRKSDKVSDKEKQDWRKETASDTPLAPDFKSEDSMSEPALSKRERRGASHRTCDLRSNIDTQDSMSEPALSKRERRGASHRTCDLRSNIDTQDSMSEPALRSRPKPLGVGGSPPHPVSENFRDYMEQESKPVPEKPDQSKIPKEVLAVEEKPKKKPKPLAYLRPDSLSHLEPKRAKAFVNHKTKRDATLDLHGLTQDAAYEAVCQFIDGCYAAKKRHVRIITGKGLGILQEQLIYWLNNPHLRPKITAISYASPKEGGEGVLLLLLKRA